MSATVLVVRHGESTWNRAGRVQGWAPTELTDRGHEQAAALADAVAARAPDRLVTSDTPRAFQTAAAVGRATGLDPVTDERWRERDFGRVQGLTSAEARERFPSVLASGEGAAPEGGESAADHRARVAAAWADLRADFAEEETAVVAAHGGTLYALARTVTGEPGDRTFPEGPKNCGVTELRVDGDDARVVRANDTDHLTGALSPD